MKKQFALLPLLMFLLSCNNGKEEKNNATDTSTTSSGKPVMSPTESPMNPYASVDVSPMDMSYYPVEYPKLKMAKATTSPPKARIIYSRPHLQGRHVFDEVLQYGQPWRLGANESTELELYSDAVIQDKNVKAGRYVMYCIPQPKEWTIILNSNIDSWGLQPDPAKDVVRFTAPVITVDQSFEYFTIVFAETASGTDLLIAWDNVEVRLPVTF